MFFDAQKLIWKGGEVDAKAGRLAGLSVSSFLRLDFVGFLSRKKTGNRTEMGLIE